MAQAHAGAMLFASTALFLAPYNDSNCVMLLHAGSFTKTVQEYVRQLQYFCSISCAESDSNACLPDTRSVKQL